MAKGLVRSAINGFIIIIIIVRELMGRVRNVVLVNVFLDLGKTRGGWDFG